MKIHLMPLRFELTWPIKAFTEDKIAQLNGLSTGITSANVVLSRHHAAKAGRRFTAKVRLAIPGQRVHAADSAGDLYAAIDRVQSKLARQLRKRKTRLSDTCLRRFQRQRERAKLLGIA